MPSGNISFYQYLVAAFRYKLFKNRNAVSFRYLNYNLNYPKIFYYARRVFPPFYRNEFPDTEEGNLQMAETILKKLDRHQDPVLDRYFNPATAPAENDPIIAEVTMTSVASGPASPIAGPPSVTTVPPINIPTETTIQTATPPEQTPPANGPTAPTAASPKLNLRGFKFPASFTNTAKKFGSAAGRFFQRNVGKYLTVGRVTTVVSSGIGAVTGAGLTGGSTIGILGGGGLGALAPSWIRSGGAAKFLGQVGNGAINVGVNISNQVSSNPIIKSPTKKVWLIFLGVFLLLVLGTGFMAAVTPSQQQPQTGTTPKTEPVASCPVPGGTISTPSYNADPVNGHCGSSYGYTCRCGTLGRRAKAIDAPTNGKNVVLPQIEGQDVTWKLIVGPYPVDSGEGGGVGYTFEAKVGSDIWDLDMLHLQTSSLTFGSEYKSGTVISQSAGAHIHTTMGKNLQNTPVAGTATDCDSGWLPSDFMCK